MDSTPGSRLYSYAGYGPLEQVLLTDEKEDYSEQTGFNTFQAAPEKGNSDTFM